jgi:hypothetical protein
MKKSSKTKKTIIKIEFDNDEAAMGFASWLCGSGEQAYWNWQEAREEEETEGDVTAIHFDYHKEDETKAKNDKDRYGEFMSDWTIRTTCGRLDNH